MPRTAGLHPQFEGTKKVTGADRERALSGHDFGTRLSRGPRTSAWARPTRGALAPAWGVLSLAGLSRALTQAARLLKPFQWVWG